MPGLKLTREQVCRLWGVGRDTCDAALTLLLTEGFLHQTGTGKYVALPRPAGSAIGLRASDLRTIRCPHCGKRNDIELVPTLSGHGAGLTARCEGCQRIIGPATRSA
jgi:hypothetical protein